MIITPDIYFNNPRMNIAVQYDPRHSVFPNLDHHPWMASPTTPTQVVKEEPRDDTEYGQNSQDSRLPLTPPPSYQGYPPANAYRDATPPKDTPPASTPSPQDKQEGSSSSNSEGEYYESGDSLKRLQMAIHRTGMITEEKLQCPVCEFSCSVRSQFNEHLLSHETKCSMCDFNGETSEKLREHMRNVHDCDDDSTWGDEELNTPKVNSQGKVKTFRCKQCEFSAVTKLEFWVHSRSHIKQERLLTCPKCPFVTEYKHHLEYHLRNHFGSKPFKCDKCTYSCVNKSMLNSHLKSHSNVYQFRCANCTYATKYCHSLKLHLRKYSHNPAMVLNPDGSPNPLPIVDVYGTRRGPKQKPKQDHQPQPQPQPQPPQQPQVPNVFNPYSLLPTQMPYYNILNGFGGFSFPQDVNMEERNNNVEKDEVREERVPLDLSCPEPMIVEDSNQEAPVKNRRKGKAFKLDRIALRLQQQVEVDEQQPHNQQPTPPPMVSEPAKSPPIKSCEPDSVQKFKQTEPNHYTCTYCDISFKDVVMYTMHMGYHGFEDPYKCNMCGQQTTDKLAFFLHIARTSHS
ncbi:protein hunchback [Halyomorpha halys]|uniref:protein hunchback n=1 Tax=Halyomorpha halys TaxID=286706 RepID=UPI0006D4DA74|nr:protein hunchback isoform X2 [Halyomorpha halys]